MNARSIKFLAVGLLAILPMAAQGQELIPAPPQSAPQGYVQTQYDATAPQPGAMPMMSSTPMPLSPTPPSAMPQQMPQQQAYTQEQIDQMLAPIALYPDPLVSQILMASTYPLEVVEAQRWREDPQNAALAGPQLQAALEQQPWDPSVKSLIMFPQVLGMMNNNLQWTEQLGDAFLASQPAIMDEIQNLRHRAQAAGDLASTPQQTVTQQQGEIIIQPANPQVVYVPYYNPTVVYGAWPWAAYPPYYFPPPPGYIYATVGLFGFGLGIGIADWLWGWDHWDWHRHMIIVDQSRFTALNGGRPFHFAANGAWSHDPDHRHGVPYRNAAVRQQFGGAALQARMGYRGYFNSPANRGTGNFHQAAISGTGRSSEQPQARFGTSYSAAGRTQNNFAQPRSNAAETSGNRIAQPMSQAHMNATPATASRSMSQPRSAPMFESFSRGSQVRMEGARGSTSRTSMQSYARPESHSSPAQHTNGGERGGASQGGGQQNRH